MTFEYIENWKNPATGRMKKHVYLLDGKQVTGVTTVLGVLAKPALIQWSADMTAEWIRENADKTQFTDGTNGWTVDEEDLQEAVKAHAKKKEAAGDRGTDVHALVEDYIKRCIAENEGNTIDIDTEDKMVAQFIEWAIGNKVRFLESEKQVYSEEWFVAGTFDFSFEKDGKRYIGDLKTMKKMWDRVPFFQCAAYMKMSEEMGERPYQGSCIVNINKETNELTEHWTYDHESDRLAFEAALTLYRQLANF